VGRKRRTPGDPAKVVGYVRVSTDDQALSPDAQRDALERWCEDNERALVHVCEDRGVSGAADLDKRPGLLEAIAAIREYKAGVLLVFRLDRLSRSVSKGAVIEELIEREGARALSCDGVGNDATPEGALLKNMIRSVAQYERQIIALRTRVALQAKKRRGQRHNCRAPYGFRWSDDGQIQELATEQRAIDTIRRLRDDGASIAAISEHLNERSRRFPPRGAAWHPTTVYRIVCRFREDETAA
jgi:site-specific DNA recombinase